MRGRFIVIEGIDGSGKSTQAARLARALVRHGRKVRRTREPGDTPLGERIRGVLLDAKHREMTPLTEVFLYMASRAQLLDQLVRPALRRGIDVVCDRYYYSTAAYQGAAGGIGPRAVLDLAERFARFERPDLVAILDLPPAEARARRRTHGDRIERKGLAFQRRVRRGFLALSRRRYVRVLNASRPAAEVFADLWKEVQAVL